MEKDVLTGEARQYTGPPSVSSFSPNHPSHHHSGHNHYGNVELIGHQPLVASRSYGYSTVSQYETGTTTQGQVPCSRIGMGPTDSSSSEMEEGRIEWEVTSVCGWGVCVGVCVGVDVGWVGGSVGECESVKVSTQ